MSSLSRPFDFDLPHLEKGVSGVGLRLTLKTQQQFKKNPQK
jgi:hypothetical protein